jgi:signal transduction histidine kinase
MRRDPRDAEHTRIESMLLEIADAEHQLLARRLHDEVGQRLTGVALLLRALTDRLEAIDPAEARNASEIQSALRAAIGSIRQISRAIPIVPPDATDLRRALEELVAHHAPTLGLQCEIEAPPVLEVREQSTFCHLYLMVHQAMFMVTELGGAKRMVVRLTCGEAAGTLEIEADAWADGGLASDLGASILRHRADLLGDALIMQASPEGGTRMLCSFRLA